MANYRVGGIQTGEVVWKPSDSTVNVSEGFSLGIVDRTVDPANSLLVEHIVDLGVQRQVLPEPKRKE